MKFYDNLPFPVVASPINVWRISLFDYLYRNEIRPETIITTRLDDDDALAVDGIERIQNNLYRDGQHHVHSFVNGVTLTDRGLVADFAKLSNQFVTLEAPISNLVTISDVMHGQVKELDVNRKIKLIDGQGEPNFIWYRHTDSKSVMFRKRGGDHYTKVQDRFTVNWSAMEKIFDPCKEKWNDILRYAETTQPNTSSLQPDITIVSVIPRTKAYIDNFNSVLRTSLNECGNPPFVVVQGFGSINIGLELEKIRKTISTRYILFCHPDAKFSKDIFDPVEDLFNNQNAGILGLIGVVGWHRKKYIWSRTLNKPQSVYTLDGCFGIIDQEHDVHFDYETFNGRHMYLEDYCYQQRALGRGIYVLPSTFCGHGPHPKKAGWNTEFKRFKGALRKKWGQKYRIVTV